MTLIIFTIGLALFIFLIIRCCQPRMPPPERKVVSSSFGPLNEDRVSALYQHLEDDHIRVLVIQKGQGKQPIVCTLQTRTLKRTRWGDEGYEALSYVWTPQPQSPNTDVSNGIINLETSTRPKRNIPFAVSWSLMRALSHLRRPDKSRVIWIDQICLNQHKSLPPQEKDQQMALMPQIYRNATQVITWLGELTEEIEPVFHITDRHHNLGEAEKRGLLNLINRDNWTRVWIIQELALAPTEEGIFEPPGIIFQCDSCTLDYKLFTSMVESLDSASFNATDVYNIFRNIARGSVQAAIRTSVRPIQMLRLYAQRRSEGREEPVTLLQMIQGLRNWNCSEPVDRIAALEALSNRDEFQVVAPTYRNKYEGDPSSKPCVDEELLTFLREFGSVFEVGKAMPGHDRTTLFALVKAFGGLVTSYADLTHRLDGLNCHTGPRHEHLPSWIPNFWAKNTRYSLIQSQRTAFNWFSDPSPVYETATSRKPDFQWDGLGVLSVQGFFVDKVVDVAEPLSPDFDSVTSVERANQELIDWTRSGVWDQISSWRPGMYGDDPGGFNGAIRRVATGNVEYRGSHRSLTQEEMNILDDDLSHPNPLEQTAQMFPEAVLRIQLRRRFFRTSLGFVGVGPEEMAVGDVLAIFFGGQTPFLVRRRPDVFSSSHWAFVGDCYVQKLMHRNTLEAWESMPDSETNNGIGTEFLIT